MEQQTHIFYVEGMHCQACVMLTESVLTDQPHISQAKSDLVTCSVAVTGDFGKKDRVMIAKDLSALLASHGYTVMNEKSKKNIEWHDFFIALPIALGCIVIFILLQKLGIVNLINSEQVTYGTAFVIGIVASLSTCMAMVGGLVLSMSATFAQSGKTVRPQLLFHIGRIISFFILGGVIGLLGSAFALGTTGIFILSVLVGIVMIILGINLLNMFPWVKRLIPSMPIFLSRYAIKVTKYNYTITPAFIGIITFFLPCGFTQSMQLYALSTGSFLTGGLTMLFFALGTLPVLALVSFSSLTIGQGLKASIFFKTVGLIVIGFGLFNIINSLRAIGVLPPLVNF